MAKIMCIDDDRDILESCRMTLEKAGHTVECASSGKEGLTKMKAFRPDLFLLDVMMDDLTDGFHTAYAIRHDADVKDKPIIMLTSINKETGLGFNKDKDGNFLPVDEFIEKPIAPKLLIELVAKLLQMPKNKINMGGTTSMY